MSRPRDTPRCHGLSPEQFAALARGEGDPATITQLAAVRQSKHMILLAKVAAMARSGERPDDPLGVVGCRLLARVQRRDPGAAAEVMSYPSVGAWARQVIRGGAPPRAGGMPPAEARPSGLASVAAAAAVRAGLDSEIEVPVAGGAVLLPSLGAADALGGTAVVRAAGDPGRAMVCSAAGGERRRVRAARGNQGWREIRRIGTGSFRVLLDDLDPFRSATAADRPAGRLAEDQAEGFRAMVRAAWPLLSPARAGEAAEMIRVIVPGQPGEDGQGSSTSSRLPGAVAMARPPGAYACAETIVHETQHLKLYALLDLVALAQPDGGQRYYAPWRSDPRPASGLLQGAYAFMGVAGFWREQRYAAPDPEVRRRGHAEFARWRDGAAEVAGTLLSSGELTRAGVAFVEGMAGVLARWRREPVPAAALARARDESGRHRDRWEAAGGSPAR